ncbi:mannan endo-1,4-beta-mannosidase 2-like [Senna tora]|uniref:mannan endo-1,4-beta-mannosidase n=1 Tax=Senna tora TaxID=362788 RepID=A0A834SNJ9_9FABA|nr:mannan endo-1,4-beta-mannosidase 2-like [Senna tora]
MLFSERSRYPHQSQKGGWESHKFRWFSPSGIYRSMVAGNGLFYPILGFASCVLFIYMSFGDLRALDYVIAEARRHRIRLLLTLVNNLHAYGGKTQYVKWAWEEGIGLSSSNDSFFYDPSIRSYFKNYIKTVLTRKNTITGIEYRYDPAIFGWELINEPRCMTDPSGDTLQDWIEEMSAFVKLIDKNHLVTVGLEGFYGPNDPKRSTVNPEEWASRLGSDFIRNSRIANIDFTSVHIYPDHWLHKPDFEDNLKFVSKWMLSHIEDGDKVLKKPVLFSEYGWSDLTKNFSPSDREKMYRTILDVIYKSAKKNRSGAGALVWQFIVEGLNEHHDDFGMVPWARSSTYSLFVQQSCRLAKVTGLTQRDRSFRVSDTPLLSFSEATLSKSSSSFFTSLLRALRSPISIPSPSSTSSSLKAMYLRRLLVTGAGGGETKATFLLPAIISPSNLLKHERTSETGLGFLILKSVSRSAGRLLTSKRRPPVDQWASLTHDINGSERVTGG